MEILTGALLVLLGVVVISLPLFTSVGIAFLVACAFGAGSLVHLFRAMMAREFSSSALQTFTGLLYFVIAVAILRHPYWGAVGLALVVSATLATEGIVAIVAYFTVGAGGSIWLLLSAIVTVTIGFVAWMLSILAPAAVLSALVGMNLMVSGVGRMITAVEAWPLRET